MDIRSSSRLSLCDRHQPRGNGRDASFDFPENLPRDFLLWAGLVFGLTPARNQTIPIIV